MTLRWLVLGYGLNGLGVYSADQALVRHCLAVKSRRDMIVRVGGG